MMVDGSSSGQGGHAFQCGVPMVLQTCLALADLAIEAVHEQIDRLVEVVRHLLEEDVLTLQMNRHFDRVPPRPTGSGLAPREDRDTHNLPEVPHRAFEFVHDVLADGRRDLEPVTFDGQIVRHSNRLLVPHEVLLRVR